MKNTNIKSRRTSAVSSGARQRKKEAAAAEQAARAAANAVALKEKLDAAERTLLSDPDAVTLGQLRLLATHRPDGELKFSGRGRHRLEQEDDRIEAEAARKARYKKATALLSKPRYDFITPGKKTPAPSSVNTVWDRYLTR
jgi:hypothetical protein